MLKPYQVRVRGCAATVVLAVMLLGVACVKKPSGDASAWEKVSSYNASLAQVNQTVEQGAEALASSKVLKPAQVEPIIDLTGRVATVDQQITAVLSKGASATPADFANLQQLLIQIQQASTTLVLSGSLGVKNPNSQQAISADITAIANLSQVILDLIPQLQASPPPAQ